MNDDVGNYKILCYWYALIPD